MSIDVMIMLISAAGGFVSQLYANSQEDKHKQMMEAMGSVQEAKKDPADRFIRTTISLVLLGLLSFVMMAPAFMDTQVVMVEKGWLWNTTTVIKGIVYDDNFRMMLQAMTFFYLGRSPAVR